MLQNFSLTGFTIYREITRTFNESDSGITIANPSYLLVKTENIAFLTYGNGFEENLLNLLDYMLLKTY